MNIKTSRIIKSNRFIRNVFLTCMVLCLGSIAFPSYAFDQDSDGVDDGMDNCLLVANPAQRDTDADGYGNYCDADFDNNLIISAADLFYLKSNFFTTDPGSDLNGDGAVNGSDLFILKASFFGSPGPSGLLPQNLQAMPGDSRVSLSWDSVVGATSYNIYWNTTGGVTTADTKITGIISPYDHTGLTNGTTYYYLVTAVNAAGESAPSGEVLAIPNVYTVCYVSSAAIDDSGDCLSPAMAKQTIPAAIAAVTAPAIVLVSAGTYDVNSDTTGTPTHVVLSEGISLYGGYSTDFSVRNPVVNITTITDYSTLSTGGITSPNSALEAGFGISAATIVDGFVLNGSGQLGADYTAAVWVRNGGAPTLQNNILNGGGGNNATLGILNMSSLPTVQNNTINGGSGGASYGMYNFVTSSPTVRNNTINGGSGAASYGINNLSSSPSVQRNTINGGSGGISYAMSNHGGSPIVQNNALNGGSGIDTYGMFNSDVSTMIVQHNTLNGGSGSDSSTGMLNFSSFPTVQNNTLNGGSGGNISSGMFNYMSSPTVQNNTLDGGSGGDSFGMLNTSSSPLVLNNTVNGGSGVISSVAMGNSDGSSPTVQNNTLDGGSGGSNSFGMTNFGSSPIVQNNTLSGGSGSFGTIGIYNVSFSSPMLQNNTINGGTGGSGSFGVYNISSTPQIDNNIIFTRGASEMHCIYEQDRGSDPSSVRNNDLFACTTVYRDFGAGCTGNGDGDADPTTCTLEEMQALTDFIPFGASGNVSTDPRFADIDGPDNNINTMDDNDWHFSVSSPVSVTTGGLNGEDDGGWGFTTDKDGLARPGTGSNWSIGAYEP